MHLKSEQPAKRELDTYVCGKPQRDLSVRRAAVADLPPLVERARLEISGALADADHIARVLRHNGECMWVVERTGPDGRRKTVGIHAFLPLSAAGREALFRGCFASVKPALEHIATRREQPVALYWWASLGTGTSATAITHIMRKLRAPRYRRLNIYSRPATPHGARALLNAGFRPLAAGIDPIGALVRYRRLANRAPAAPRHLH